jgi:hypothetical protein
MSRARGPAADFGRTFAAGAPLMSHWKLIYDLTVGLIVGGVTFYLCAREIRSFVRRPKPPPPPPTILSAEVVIAKVKAAIAEKDRGWEVWLHVAEYPDASNNATWTICEVVIGSAWVARVSDVTGEITALECAGGR